jgi:hypothetical protein
MGRRSIYRVYAWLLVLIGFLWSATSYAIVVRVDQFSVTRNGVAVFTDGFTDGAEPPSAPNFASGTPASYAIVGTIPGTAESGGVLLLNSANGALLPNAAGAARRNVIATLLTDTSADLSLGLKSDDTLRVSGTFGLTTPTGPLFSAYGVRFIDGTAGSVDQLLQLFVRYNEATGQAELVYILQDFDADTITTFGAVPLASFVPVGADQITLFIERPDTGNNNFFGHFEFLAGGVPIGGHSIFNTPGQMFQGENFVRAQFFVAEAVRVPEPSAGWLTIAALLLLASTVGTRSKRTRIIGG